MSRFLPLINGLPLRGIRHTLLVALCDEAKRGDGRQWLLFRSSMSRNKDPSRCSTPLRILRSSGWPIESDRVAAIEKRGESVIDLCLTTSLVLTRADPRRQLPRRSLRYAYRMKPGAFCNLLAELLAAMRGGELDGAVDAKRIAVLRRLGL